MMTRPLDVPGAPFPLLLPSEQVVAVVGEFDAGDGVRIAFRGNDLVFTAHVDGNEVFAGIPIDLLLEHLTDYTHRHES